MKRLLVGAVVVALSALLVTLFVRALPDAVEREHVGRRNRIKAICDEALRPEPSNPVLGPLPAPAPPFEVQDFQGRPLSLASLRGRVVLLNFWFSTCPPCVQEVPSLERLARAEKGRPFTLLAVSVDPDWPTVRRFFAGGSALTVGLDPQKLVPPRYGTEKFPESFLIDKDGQVLSYVVSDRDWSTPGARACIDALLD